MLFLMVFHRGSIPGPVLFTFYINESLKISKFGSLESYVDEPRLYLSFSVNNACSVVQQSSDDLLKIAFWCC